MSIIPSNGVTNGSVKNHSDTSVPLLNQVAADNERTTGVTEIILFGTGTSGCVPAVSCLTQQPPTCKVCRSAVDEPDKSRNFRLNTSAMMRWPKAIGDDNKDGDSMVNVLIDCGKTFYTQAVRWCDRYQLRRLDAVFLTHGHADACLGLDDLRQWTLNAQVQSHVDIYLSEETMTFVRGAFPYLVDTSKASGGGDVAGVRFHILKVVESTVSLEESIATLNLVVGDCGEQQSQSNCNATGPRIYEPVIVNGVRVQPFEVEHGKQAGAPYYCLGFRFGDGHPGSDVCYLSDVSHVPSGAEKYLAECRVLVLDGLHDKPHPSHFSIDQAVEWIRRVRPTLGLLTGFSHRVDHWELFDRLREQELSRMSKLRVEPAYDGQRIVIASLETEQTHD